MFVLCHKVFNVLLHPKNNSHKPQLKKTCLRKQTRAADSLHSLVHFVYVQ